MSDSPVNPAAPDPSESEEALEVIAAAPVEPAPAPEPASATPAPEAEAASTSQPAAAAVEPQSAVAEPGPEPEAPSDEPVAPAAPMPEPPAAAPAVAPAAPPSATPAIAITLEAPPQLDATAAASGDGGEFELLVGKVKDFLDGDSLRNWWDKLGGPLRGVGVLIALVLVLRLYDALLGTLGDLPLVPRLLQLAGLITVLRFALTRMVRSDDRQAVLQDWKNRWQRFRGQP